MYHLSQSAALFSLPSNAFSISIPAQYPWTGGRFWFHYVTDLGLAVPDKGKGGKFIFVPPGYKGKIPTAYFVFKPKTYDLLFLTRGFVLNGDANQLQRILRKTFAYIPF